MPYDKTVWDETVPATPARLNNLETQHEKAVAESLPRAGGDISGNLTIQTKQVVHAGNIAQYAPSPANYADTAFNIYVETTGNDNNTGLSQAQAVRTIAKGVQLLKKIGALTRILYIGPGVWAEGLVMNDIGGGYVQVLARDYTNRPNLSKIECEQCTAFIWMANLNITGSAATGGATVYYGFNIDSCHYVSLGQASFSGVNYGSRVMYSRVRWNSVVANNIPGNVVDADEGSIFNVKELSGSGNDTVLSATNSIIMAGSITCTGITALEAFSGGQVFKS